MAEPGTQVRFIRPKEPHSWSLCLAQYADLLEDGGIYTVARVSVHSWHTRFYLEGFPGTPFNSVWFEVATDGQA